MFLSEPEFTHYKRIFEPLDDTEMDSVETIKSSGNLTSKQI